MTGQYDGKPMTCREFDAVMLELIASGEDINTHPHIQSCELHRALLRDLQAIADAAKMLFPAEEDPPDDLWTKLDDKLKAATNDSEKKTDHSMAKGEAAPDAEEE